MPLAKSDLRNGDGSAERLIAKRQFLLTMSHEVVKAVKLVALEDDISTTDAKSSSRSGN
jgi:hypothetical protein